MLADSARNEAFGRAVARAVEAARRESEDGEVHVLDVGAGSGLLALLARRAGADKCVAVEAQACVAAAAVRVVGEDRGTDEELARAGDALDVEIDGVRVVARHSTAVYVEGETDDEDGGGEDAAAKRCGIPRRCDVLVSEVFGQVLLEEGCISTFQDATARLLTEDAIVVPSRGRIVVTPIAWPAREGAGALKHQSLVALHRTMSGGDDVHSTVLSDEPFFGVAAPQEAFDFDFKYPEDARPGVAELVFVAERAAVVTAVAVSFELDLDDG